MDVQLRLLSVTHGQLSSLGLEAKVANSSKHFPLPTSNTSVFPGFHFSRLLFVQLLVLARSLASLEVVHFASCVKETQSQVPREYCSCFIRAALPSPHPKPG